MGPNEELALDCRVEPLVTAVRATEEVAIVNEDATPELDSYVADGKDGLENEVHVHLLSEHFL